MANELIAEAITDYLGERCLDYAEGCPTCEAWAEYDRLYTRPAAPVEGLSVAFYQVFLQGAWIDCPLSAYTVYSENGEETRKLCDQSQAEAIIAAERTEKEQAIKELKQLVVSFVREHFPENKTFNPFDDLLGLISQIDNASTVARSYVNKITTLETDNAALTVRVKGLELQLSVSKETAKIKRVEYLDLDQDHSELKADYAVSEAQLKAARKALAKLTLHSNSLALAHVHKTQKNDGIWGALKEARAALEVKP